jgi:hypothetical protein
MHAGFVHQGRQKRVELVGTDLGDAAYAPMLVGGVSAPQCDSGGGVADIQRQNAGTS